MVCTANFIGDRKNVSQVTSEGVTYKSGEFRKFPEPLVEMPIPGWIGVVGPDTSNAWSQGEWEFLSLAKERAKAFSTELEKIFQ